MPRGSRLGAYAMRLTTRRRACRPERAPRPTRGRPGETHAQPTAPCEWLQSPQLLGEKTPEHVLEDAAVAEILPLARRVEPEARAELLVVGVHGHLVGLPAFEADDR